MKKQKCAAIFLCLLLLLGILPLQAVATGDAGYQVSGYIGAMLSAKTQSGAYAVEGLTVKAMDPTGEQTWETSTDADGYFVISGLHSGDYNLIISGRTAVSRQIAFTIEDHDIQLSTEENMIGVIICDYYQNGYINVSDYTVIKSKIGLSRFDANYDLMCDLDRSGIIDAVDTEIYRNFSGKSTFYHWGSWGTYSISGSIGVMDNLKDQNGIYPIYFSITVSLFSGDTLISSCSSDVFSFTGLSSGDYTIVISGEYCIPLTIPVTIVDRDVILSDEFHQIGVIVGDRNGNGTLDADDYALFASHFEEELNAENDMFDFNGDGVIDAQDAAIFTRFFGATAQSYQTGQFGNTLSGYVGMMLSPSDSGNLDDITGLTITLQQNGQTVESTRSKGAGLFQFINVMPGEYTLIISGDTIVERQIAVTVPAGGKYLSTYQNKTGVVTCDFNHDNVIDINDIKAFNTKFGKAYPDAEYNIAYDLNLDGVIDINDQNILLALFQFSSDSYAFS